LTLGETAYAFSIDFYGFAQVAIAGRTNLMFVLPQDFTAVNPDGIAILKGAPHLAAAQAFIDFVLSEEGQRLWFLPRGHPDGPKQFSIERMSVRPDFYKRYHGISNIEFSPSISSKASATTRGLRANAATWSRPGRRAASRYARGTPGRRRASLPGMPTQDLAELGASLLGIGGACNSPLGHGKMPVRAT